MRHALTIGMLLCVAGTSCYATRAETEIGDATVDSRPDVAEGDADAGPGDESAGADGDAGFEDGRDSFDRDAWYPDHVPDGVDPSQVVVPLPLAAVTACATDSRGNPCTGTFRCCAEWSTPPEPSLQCAACVDTNVARRHCGGCGRLCPYPARCIEGVCVGPLGFAFCGCAWTDLGRDPDNCGRCGNGCPDGAECVDGRCSATEAPDACGPEELHCGDGCTVFRNPDTCGECGRRCLSFLPWETDRRDGGCSWDTDCGQCETPSERSVGLGDWIPWIWDHVGLVEEGLRVGPRCRWGDVTWLGGTCLPECPPGTAAYLWDVYVPDSVRYGTGCRPFLWSDSGWGWYETEGPWCGAPDAHCMGSGSACIDGTCLCMDGYDLCPGRYGADVECVDLSQDARNCGRCGNACADTEACTGGVCRPAG